MTWQRFFSALVVGFMAVVLGGGVSTAFIVVVVVVYSGHPMFTKPAPAREDASVGERTAIKVICQHCQRVTFAGWVTETGKYEVGRTDVASAGGGRA